MYYGGLCRHRKTHPCLPPCKGHDAVPSLKTLIDIINALDCSADELLCIEIKKAKPVFDSWMTEQLADCSVDEAKIIKETVIGLKKSLRKVYGKSSKYRYD